MRKSILTLVLFACIQMFSFAQRNQPTAALEKNLDHVQKIVDEKSDITGTFANTGNWEVFVDDAKVKITDKAIKEIEKSNVQELLQSGMKYVQKDKTEFANYRYRIVSEENDVHTMYIYKAGEY